MTKNVLEQSLEFEVIVEHDGTSYLIQVPALPEVNTFGDTPEHALVMAKEAIELSLAYRRDAGLPIPAPHSRQIRLIQVSMPTAA